MKTIDWNGKKITKPGVYAGVPLEVYHSQELFDGPSVSSSNLRRVLEENDGSPAHFYAEWTGNPNREEPKEKKHFIIGRATHHLMLGQPHFAKLFVIQPETYLDRKTGLNKAWTYNADTCKDWRAEMSVPTRDAPKGRTIMTMADVENIQGMAMALGRDAMCRDLLGGLVERSFFWKDKETGLWLKARPDAIPTDSGDYADLKTTTSVHTLNLIRTIEDFAYAQQAALIGEGSKVCADIPMSSFTLVFIEKARPWCVRPVVLDDEDLKAGAQQNRDALRIIAECLRSKRWPGPGDGHPVHVRMSDRQRKRIKDITQQREQMRHR